MNTSLDSGSFGSRLLLRRLTLLLLALLLAAPRLAVAAEEAATVESRLSTAAQYLASEELEGRGVGTKGLDLAADYLAEELSKLGLKTELFGGSPFQKFEVTYGSRLGKANRVTLIGPKADGEGEQQIELKIGKDFNPLAIGGSGSLNMPLVFAGFGITGKAENYDDYADIDVKGKAVVVLRHEPQQNNPHSVFNGTDHSRHAPFRAKVSNAYQRGAAAIIFVTDKPEIGRRVEAARQRWQTAIDELAAAHEPWKEVERPTLEEIRQQHAKIEKLAKAVQDHGRRLHDEFDPVLGFDRAGNDAMGRDIPILHCRREVIDKIVQAVHGKDLATIEAEIDKGPTPQSFELAGWRIVGQTDVEHERAEVKNVIAVLEGEGPLAEETIIVGAHYDHLGWGGPGSAEPGKRAIHHGADDNASGTAVLLEVARSLVQREKKLPRRVVFIAFTAEERGLLGSAHYANHPLVPLEKTVAMLNMDMVGRLQDDKLIVNGTGTATQWPAWLDEVNERLGFHLIKKASGIGPSDHATFYSKDIPVLHFFTGSHKDYHRSTDTADKLNVPGMRRVGEMVAQLTELIAETPERPTFQQTRQQVARRGGDRPYFGSIPDFASEDGGYAIANVSPGSPAERGGLKGGDLIIGFGESKIGNLEDFDSALRKYKAGDKVPLLVKRGGKEVKLEVVLDPPK